MNRLVAFAIATLLLTSFGGVPAGARPQDTGQEFDLAMTDGENALKKRQYEDAIRAFKKASGLRNKTSPEAHFGMARAYREMKAFKSAADSCTDALKHVGDNRGLEAGIRNIRGAALFALAEKIDDKRVKEAEQDFRAVLALTDTLPIAHFNLAVAIMRQGRDEEGIAELKRFLEVGGRLPEAAEARKLMENPKRARMTYAPDFSFVSLQGEHISLEDLRGRVVLLDYWATWCPPCVDATPSLIRLVQKYSNESFTMLGISADRAEQPWRDYIAKEKMEWPQYWDRNGQMRRLFGVNAFPTYILIDHEGVVRGTKIGGGSAASAWIDGEVRKYLKAIPTAPVPQLIAPPGGTR